MSRAHRPGFVFPQSSRTASVRKAQANTPTPAERKVSAPAVVRPATLAPTSWNAEERTVDVVWTTGARGAKFDWDAWEMVDEELDCSPSAVRLDRLNAGAAVLNAHNRAEMADQVGVVVPGSARMVNGQGIATLKLSDREEVAPLVADIAAGIVRNLSCGYLVHEYEITQRDGQRPLYRARDWEPIEISFVPVPFDPAAQVRTRGVEDLQSECVLRTIAKGALNMPATIVELREVGELMVSAGFIPADKIDAIILDMAERGIEKKEAWETMSQTAAELQNRATSGIASSGRALATTYADMIGGHNAETFDNPAFASRAIEDALYARMSGKAPTDAARAFMGMGMTDIAREMLERRGVRGVRSMRPDQVLDRAAWNSGGGRGNWIEGNTRDMGPGMGTSDFPELLTAAGNRHLIEIFNAVASPIKMCARQRTAPDFRTISGLQLSGFGALDEIREHGEVKHRGFNERKETYRLKTFSNTFTLTRQALINDDLGAFINPTRILARSAAETEASQLADLINSNPTMSDSKALFHADHGNLAASGAVPNVDTLDAARLALRSQKDLDGVTPLNPQPRYLLASPKRETAIEKLLLVPLTPDQVSEANPFTGKLIPLIDPRLMADPWYLVADPESAPVIEYAYLDGNPGPIIEMKDAWDRLGTGFRVVMDFGCGVVDHRGAYKNPGA